MAASIELSAGLPLCELSSPELSLLRCYAEQIGLGKATPRQRAKSRMFAPSRTYRNQHELPLVTQSRLLMTALGAMCWPAQMKRSGRR
jgi:hypothetical protein